LVGKGKNGSENELVAFTDDCERYLHAACCCREGRSDLRTVPHERVTSASWQLEAVRSIENTEVMSRRVSQLSAWLMLAAVNTRCDTGKYRLRCPLHARPMKPHHIPLLLAKQPNRSRKQRLESRTRTPTLETLHHLRHRGCKSAWTSAPRLFALTLPMVSQVYEEPDRGVDHALALAPTAEVAAAAPVADDSVNRGGSMAYP